jgi:hypothetical protein
MGVPWYDQELKTPPGVILSVLRKQWEEGRFHPRAWDPNSPEHVRGEPTNKELALLVRTLTYMSRQEFDERRSEFRQMWDKLEEVLFGTQAGLFSAEYADERARSKRGESAPPPWAWKRVRPDRNEERGEDNDPADADEADADEADTSSQATTEAATPSDIATTDSTGLPDLNSAAEVESQGTAE